jgi:hypothetical protein
LLNQPWLVSNNDLSQTRQIEASALHAAIL